MGGIVAKHVQVSPLSGAEYLIARERDMGVEIWGGLWNVSRCRGTCLRIPATHRTRELDICLPSISCIGYINTPDFGKSLPEMRFRFTFRSLEKRYKNGWGMTGRVIAVLLSAPSPLTPSAASYVGLLKQTRSAQSIQRQSYPFRKLHALGSALASHAMTSWFASKFIFNASCKCHEPTRVHDWWVVDRTRCTVTSFFCFGLANGENSVSCLWNC